MQKIIRLNDNKAVILLNNGEYLTVDNLTDKEFCRVILMLNKVTDETLAMAVDKNYKTKIANRNIQIEELNKIKRSRILSLKGESVYWDGVSQLSLPVSLAQAVVRAESDNDETKLTAYRNFWTLMSLNPDDRCRHNLFRFLQRYGLTIAKCGFFIGYRNMDLTCEDGVYTDHHSHTFRIKIGEMVTMPRDACDCNSNVECSSGLHIAGASWLKQNYFGDTGMVCLVNPADVVAVPYNSEYGKLRTCAYLPIKKLEYSDSGNVIPYDAETGFDCSYVSKVIYEGLSATESDPYKIKIPEAFVFDRKNIENRLYDIALQCVVDRNRQQENK